MVPKSALYVILSSKQQKVLSFPTDVTNEEEIEATLQKIKETEDKVDFLFCCAGVAKPGMFLDTPTKNFDDQMQLNYMGIVKSLKVFVPEIINSSHPNKRVILVSSAMGLSGFVGYSQYSATKYAVRGLAECLRNEFLLYDIGVSIFHASSMDSPGYEVEEKTKPEITRKIEGTSTLFQYVYCLTILSTYNFCFIRPSEAASHCLRAVENGKYHICSDMVIELMRMTGNG